MARPTFELRRLVRLLHDRVHFLSRTAEAYGYPWPPDLLTGADSKVTAERRDDGEETVASTLDMSTNVASTVSAERQMLLVGDVLAEFEKRCLLSPSFNRSGKWKTLPQIEAAFYYSQQLLKLPTDHPRQFQPAQRALVASATFVSQHAATRHPRTSSPAR